MRICVAQTRPVTGDIERNIVNHKRLIDLATSAGADTIIFPELSLTGYEPELARELAITLDDDRLDDFQRIADARRITIGVGVPLRDEASVRIGMVLFQPYEARQAYTKQYLHPDEEAFFVGGRCAVGSIGGGVALAICYELSVPAHAEEAARSGARVYIASVAKTAGGVDAATERLSEIARRYEQTALMANCVGRSGGMECGGRSSIWNSEGLLVGRLSDADEGVLIFDTKTPGSDRTEAVRIVVGSRTAPRHRARAVRLNE